ncbi:hypothetical protein [Nocardiopsis quinghaiensis]|uniref:hypothetical protein n=1 Tax=Nocardiopsis quinghaiensis TaxID=464995 RepID=UPI00123C26F0|nr:hypothetical protein [Nocardiopsis quinghaiensis]
MIRAGRGFGLSRVVPTVLGGIMIGLGVLSVGYGAWAWVESRAYLADVTASGQMVEAFDAANFVMSSAGLFLLIGLLLMANGGLFLVAGRLLSRPTLPQPMMPAASAPARPVQQEDDLDDLLDDIEV